MASSPARRRFFAARAAIAKRQAANDAAVFAVPPAGQFRMRISNADGAVITYRLDGLMQLGSARLFLADGSEIDGATVDVVSDIASDVANLLEFSDLDVEGDAIVTDDGYRLVALQEVDMRQAA